MTTASPLSPLDQLRTFWQGPKPVPCDPNEGECSVDAWEVFTPDVLSLVLQRNAGWLQFSSRDTGEVLKALFCPFDFGDMGIDEIHSRLNDALWDAGYRPSDRTLNPRWIHGSEY